MASLLRKLAKPMSRSLALAAVLGVLLTPVMAQTAGTCIDPTGNNCSDNRCFCSIGNLLCGVSNPSGCALCTIPGAACPEMPDYLAAAFVVVAGGMMLYLRRRSLAST